MRTAPLIARRSLHDEIVALMRDMIIDGTLRPGAKVPERELCQRFGVSRTPLREALKVLAAEGLIELLPNRGAVVSRIGPEAVEQLFPIMGALEALAGEVACARITDAEIATVRRLHERMLGHYAAQEWVAYSKLNRDIHEAIFAAAKNPALSTIYQNLMVRIHAVRFVARKSPERWREAIDDHVLMMRALEARDGAGLAAILKEHLRHKADSVQEALDHLDRGLAAE